jgi:hypothetical protein
VSIGHIDVAAYSLGLLDARDRDEFEAHLAQCQTCPAELAEFGAMADLFAGMGPVEAASDQPDEAAIVDLVGKRARAARRRSRQRVGLAVAASVALLAGGIAAGVAVGTQPAAPAAGPQIVGARHSVTDPATGVTATVGLLSKPWGTQVTMKLGNVYGPLECQLIAISKSGERRVLAGWLVPAAGYGVADHRGDLFVEGGTSISVPDLSQLEVQVAGGRTLLTIPV